MSVALGKIQGVESAKVSLNRGVATILLKPGNSVRLEQIREAIERNGFTPKEAKVTARGELVSTGGKLQLKLLGTDQFYDLAIDPKAGKTSEEIKEQIGETVEIDGSIPPPHPPKDPKAAKVIQLKAIRPTGARGG